MSMTYNEYLAAMIDTIATGYVTSYNVGSVGAITFATTVSSGGWSVKIDPGPMTVGSTAQAGISVLPGGRIFSPYSRANTTAPVPYPSYTQIIYYAGDIGMVAFHTERLRSLTGTTGRLSFNTGRINSQTTVPNAIGEKWCNAFLHSVTVAPMGNARANTNLTMDAGRMVTAVWQQVGDFTAS